MLSGSPRPNNGAPAGVIRGGIWDSGGRRLTIDERFDRKVVMLPTEYGGCHLYLGPVTKKGYGMFSWTSPNKTNIQAHVYADNRAHGPIAEGLERDHVCNTRCCVNADHIERVTHQENVRRAWARRRECGDSTS